MRFPDDRKHEHKPPHAEVCVSFWLDSAMHQQLHNFEHRVQLTKSIDDQEILMAILEAGNGNMEMLTTGAGGMLGSQPWKSGAVRALIGDAKFNKLFTTETKLDVKTGKPAKSVKVADSRFGPKE